MTVNLNLSGLPAVCLPCGFAQQPDGSQLPVGMQVRRGGELLCLLTSTLSPCLYRPRPSLTPPLRPLRVLTDDWPRVWRGRPAAAGPRL